jgi:two-component system, cell cycle sensor histidine kinase and response regulator CckA
MRKGTYPYAGRAAAGAAAVVASVALLGAIVGSDDLRSLGGAQVMSPIAGVALLASALALMRRGPAEDVVGALVALVGLVTIAHHAGDRDLGVTGIALNTGVALLVLGVALICLERAPRVVDGAAAVLGLIAGLALLGYAFDVEELRGLSSPLTPMSLPTAISFAGLTLRLALAHPDRGLARLIGSDTAGGALVRRLAPAAIVVPVVIAYLRLEGQREGLYGTAEGLALYCAGLVVIFFGLVIWTGEALDRAETARRLRERAIVDATVDGVITIDDGGRVHEFNAAAERMFGRRRQDVIGSELAALIVPAELRDAHRAGLARCVATGESQILGRPVELEALRADGTRFPVELTLSRMAGGRATFVGHVRDIAERLRSERAARELTALVESAADPVIAIGMDGVITSFNPAAERVYGYARGEAVGRDLQELLVAPGRRELVPELRDRLAAQGSITIESEHMRQDGSRLPVETTLSVIRDAAGAPTGASLFVRDITERRESEAAVGRLAAIVESSPDVIYTFELDGTLVSWNAGAERTFGYSAEEIIGRSIVTLSDAGPGSARVAAFFEGLERGDLFARETVMVRKDGTRLAIAYTAFPIRDPGGTILLGGVVARDVTEQHQLEDRLRQTQKMEAVGQLAGGIAHDFNNLLTIITGYGALARSSLAGKDGMEELEQIERAAQRAAELTSQLLAFSRRQLLSPVPICLGAVAEGIAPMLGRLIGEDISVVTRSAPDLPNVLADPGQIEQVIMNLAVNARDAMPDGGTLTLETGVTAYDEPDGPVPYVFLRVSDTGTGIASDTLPHVFEPFFTTKDVGEGTGLGLASVHGAITQSGGQVRVRSEVGRGTTFEILLPATDERPSEPASHGAQDGSFDGRETVMLCEDEDSVRRLLQRLLAGAGYRVLSAGRPSEALTVADAEPGRIDVLVSDVIMPDMPGPDLAELMVSRRPELRTLFLSGYTADTVHGRGGLPPGSAFLQKPFDGDTLLRTVRELLDAPR